VVSSNFKAANARVVRIIEFLNDECNISKKLLRGNSKTFLTIIYIIVRLFMKE
jgi:hypothetical protein